MPTLILILAGANAAVAEHPTSPLARASLALRIYAQPGSQQEAQSLLTDVLRDYPQFPEAHRGLALRPRDKLMRQELSECRRAAGGR